MLVENNGQHVYNGAKFTAQIMPENFSLNVDETEYHLLQPFVDVTFPHKTQSILSLNLHLREVLIN